MELTKNEAIIEAILFATGEAIPISRLADAIATDVKLADKSIKSLIDKYSAEQRGITIIETDGAYQMGTNPNYFTYIEKFVSIPQKRTLTQPLLETLAIIAYKQPVTKVEIEEIRGVNADHAVNKLMEYGLVEEKGRREGPGRSILLGTSSEFLKYFGFNNLSKLPALEADIQRLKDEATQEMDLPEYI